MALGLEAKDRSDRGLNESFGKSPRQQMGCLPTGAVRGNKALYSPFCELGDRSLDDGLEAGPGQVQASHVPRDVLNAGALAIAHQTVHPPGMGASRHHYQALTGDVHHHVLIVCYPGIGLPGASRLGEMYGKPTLEVGDARDLSRHEHRVIHQQRRAPLLYHFQPLALQIALPGRGKADPHSGGKANLPLPPCMRMDEQRHAVTATAPEEPFQAAVMVDVAMGDDERAELTDGKLHYRKVARQAVRRQAAVVEDRGAVAGLV